MQTSKLASQTLVYWNIRVRQVGSTYIASETEKWAKMYCKHHSQLRIPLDTSDFSHSCQHGM